MLVKAPVSVLNSVLQGIAASISYRQYVQWLNAPRSTFLIYLPAKMWYQFLSEFEFSFTEEEWDEVSKGMDEIYRIHNREHFILFQMECPGSCHPHHKAIAPEYH